MIIMIFFKKYIINAYIFGIIIRDFGYDYKYKKTHLLKIISKFNIKFYQNFFFFSMIINLGIESDKNVRFYS